MIEQMPTTIKVSGPEGIIATVIPTAVSEQFSNSGVHEVHIEWSTSDGTLTGTVLTTPLHLAETLDKGGFFEPASVYKHYATQPTFKDAEQSWYGKPFETDGTLLPQPKADLSQIAADLSKLPAVTTPKKKPGPKAKVVKGTPAQLAVKATGGEIFFDHEGKWPPIGKVTDMKMTTGGAELEAKLTDNFSAKVAEGWGVPFDMITIDEASTVFTAAQVAEHVMREAAKQAKDVLYHGLANAKDFLPVGNTLNGVEYVELGGHKYDILLTIKHKEVKP